MQRITALVLAVFIFGAFVPMFSAGLTQPVQAEARESVYLAAIPSDDPQDLPTPPTNEAADDENPDAITTDPDQETPNLSESTQDTCRDSFGGLSWILCPVFDIVADGARIAGDWLIGLLEFDPVITDITEQGPTNSALYESWSIFRDIANVLLVIAFMFIIYLITTGSQAYAVQRMLPRLVIATIGIQLSFVISALMVDIGNVLGAGIAELFSSINQQVVDNINFSELGLNFFEGSRAGFDVDPTVQQVGGSVAAAVGWLLTLIFIVLFVSSAVFPPFLVVFVSAAVGLFVTLVILGLRQIAIVVLIVTSPLSFILAIFPGTQGIFKEWSDNLIKLILIYPLVVLLFSVSGLLSSLALLTSGQSQLGQFMATLLPAATLFMVPYLFRFAGRIFRGAGGLIQGGGKSLTQGILGDYNDPGSARSRARLRSLTARRDRNIIGQKAISSSPLGKSFHVPGKKKPVNLPGLPTPLKTNRMIRQLGGGIYEGIIDPDADADMAKRWLWGGNEIESMDGTEKWNRTNDDSNKGGLDKTDYGQYEIAQMNRDENAVIQSTKAAAGWIGGSFDRALNSYYAVGQQRRTGELAPDMAETKLAVLTDVTKGANRALSVINHEDLGRVADGSIKSPRQLYEAIYSNDEERRQVIGSDGNRTGELMFDDETRLKRKRLARDIMGNTLTERNGEVDFRAGASILSDQDLLQEAQNDPGQRQKMINLIERARSLDQRGAEAREVAVQNGQDPDRAATAGFFGKSGAEAVSMKHFIKQAFDAADAIGYDAGAPNNPDITREQ